MIPNIYLSDKQIMKVEDRVNPFAAFVQGHFRDISENKRAIAKAAANNAVKQVVEWLFDWCTEHEDSMYRRRNCPDCLVALKKLALDK